MTNIANLLTNVSVSKESARILKVEPCELCARRAQTRTSEKQNEVVKEGSERTDKGSEVVKEF